jgi:hypothetical protein
MQAFFKFHIEDCIKFGDNDINLLVKIHYEFDGDNSVKATQKNFFLIFLNKLIINN